MERYAPSAKDLAGRGRGLPSMTIEINEGRAAARTRIISCSIWNTSGADLLHQRCPASARPQRSSQALT